MNDRYTLFSHSHGPASCLDRENGDASCLDRENCDSYTKTHHQQLQQQKCKSGPKGWTLAQPQKWSISFTGAIINLAHLEACRKLVFWASRAVSLPVVHTSEAELVSPGTSTIPPPLSSPPLTSSTIPNRLKSCTHTHEQYEHTTLFLAALLGYRC